MSNSSVNEFGSEEIYLFLSCREENSKGYNVFLLCGLLSIYVSKLVGINSLLTPVFFESVLLSCWFCWYVLTWKQTKPWRLRMKTHQSWDKFFNAPLKNIIHVNHLTLQEKKEDRILIISCNLEHLPTPCNKPKQNVLWILLKYWYKINQIIYIARVGNNLQFVSTNMWLAYLASIGNGGCKQCSEVAPLRSESAKHLTI